MTKAEIKDYLKEYCTEVYDMPESELELKMDNHYCIKWNGKEYFISDSNMDTSNDDIREHLIDNYRL